MQADLDSIHMSLENTPIPSHEILVDHRYPDLNAHPRQKWVAQPSFHNQPTRPGWWFQPIWKIWKSVGMMTFPIYGTIKNVPNHQPEALFSLKRSVFRSLSTVAGSSSKGHHQAKLLRTAALILWGHGMIPINWHNMLKYHQMGPKQMYNIDKPYEHYEYIRC